ncbi:hypothetical protein N7454_001706 [Penicillium verhagenii]|nr:hypothetical protein N7454_001706 [Penicillium verhagenii]
MQIPQEIYDHIVYHVGNEYSPFIYYIEHVARHFAISSESRKNLALLRLVNWGFCRSASPWLFRHINAQSVTYPSTEISALERLINLSKSHYATHVDQLDFGFARNYASTDRPVDSLYIKDLAEFYSPLLVKFTNLKALVFTEPPSLSPRDMRNLYMDTVISILHYVPLPSLTELEVHFPITYDFGRFFPSRLNSLQIPIKDVMQRLRHLSLRVEAFTDVVDQRYWQTPILPEHAALPNTTYAPRFFSVVELASNLETLELSSRNILDIDFLPFPSSLCLQCLCLVGVSVSYETLLALINQSAHKIQYIVLTLLKLKSGTWQRLLLEMCKLPSLLDIRVQHSGYSLTGSSSHLADRLLPLPDHPSNIESIHDFDLNALGNLQRRVNANRIGLGLKPFPETDYRHIHKSSATDWGSSDLIPAGLLFDIDLGEILCDANDALLLILFLGIDIISILQNLESLRSGINGGLGINDRVFLGILVDTLTLARSFRRFLALGAIFGGLLGGSSGWLLRGLRARGSSGTSFNGRHSGSASVSGSRISTGMAISVNFLQGTQREVEGHSRSAGRVSGLHTQLVKIGLIYNVSFVSVSKVESGLDNSATFELRRVKEGLDVVEIRTRSE